MTDTPLPGVAPPCLGDSEAEVVHQTWFVNGPRDRLARAAAHLADVRDVTMTVRTKIPNDGREPEPVEPEPSPPRPPAEIGPYPLRRPKGEKRRRIPLDEYHIRPGDKVRTIRKIGKKHLSADEPGTLLKLEGVVGGYRAPVRWHDPADSEAASVVTGGQLYRVEKGPAWDDQNYGKER